VKLPVITLLVIETAGDRYKLMLAAPPAPDAEQVMVSWGNSSVWPSWRMKLAPAGAEAVAVVVVLHKFWPNAMPVNIITAQDRPKSFFRKSAIFPSPK
jgi:hypothetical protein